MVEWNANLIGEKKNQDDSILYSGAAKFWGSFFVTPHILNPP